MVADEQPAAEVFSVRLIRALRDHLHAQGRRLVLAAFVLSMVTWFGGSVSTIDTGETAAVLRLGKLVDDAVGPGLHVALPPGIDETILFSTGEVFRLELNGDDGAPLGIMTGDTNLIETSAVVQYRISRLGDFLFGAEYPEELLRQTVRAALVETFGITPVDEVLTSAKAGLQIEVRRRVQAHLDAYGVGVTVVAINLQSVDPPLEAAMAFRAVSDARAEAAQAVNHAEGRRGRALRLARGEAERTLEMARSVAHRRVQEAQGAAARYRSLLERYRRSPQQIRVELFRSALEKALPKARLIVMGPGETPKLGIHLSAGRSGGAAPLPPLPVPEKDPSGAFEEP